MNNLFFCCTLYQLIVCIQIKQKLFPEDYSVLLLSDDSNEADQIVERIKTIKIFDEAFLVKKKQEYFFKKPRFKDKIRRLIYASVGCTCFADVSKKQFDRLFYYNDDFYTLWLYASVTKLNKNIEIIKYEEGPISYYVDLMGKNGTSYHYYSSKIREFLRCPVFYKNEHEFLCFNPGTYSGKLQVASLPKISKEDDAFRMTLSQLFCVNKDKFDYHQKYIYFSSMIDKEYGIEGGEKEIVDLLANVVGKDQIIVKTHPRDKKPDFIDAGYMVDQYSSVPFEVIQLIHRFDNNIFITMMSGSVLTINSMIEDPVPVLFTFDLYPKKNIEFVEYWSKKYTELINKMIEGNAKLQITIVKSKEELREKVECIENKKELIKSM